MLQPSTMIGSLLVIVYNIKYYSLFTLDSLELILSTTLYTIFTNIKMYIVVFNTNYYSCDFQSTSVNSRKNIIDSQKNYFGTTNGGYTILFLNNLREWEFFVFI